jgi:hypothetical protein
MAKFRTGEPAPGRFDLGGARAPANGLASPPRGGRNNTNAFAVVAIPDPDPHDAHGRTEALARLDLLDLELKHHRISQAAHHVGKEITRAYERVPGAVGSNWMGGSRVSAMSAQSAAFDRMEEAREKILEIEKRAFRIIGEAGVPFIVRFLRDGWSYRQFAYETKRLGSRADISKIADRFRWLMNELGQKWNAKPND